MHKTVLSQQIALKFLSGDRTRMMPGQTVDFESEFLIRCPNRVINVAASPVDVLERVFMDKQLNFLQAKDLGEQFDKRVFGCTRNSLAFVDLHSRDGSAGFRNYAGAQILVSKQKRRPGGQARSTIGGRRAANIVAVDCTHRRSAARTNYSDGAEGRRR